MILAVGGLIYIFYSKKLLNSKDVTPYGFDPIEYIDGDKELNPYFPDQEYIESGISHTKRQERQKTKDKEEFEDEKQSTRIRKPLTQQVKDQVWNRDGGKCVECDSNENLEFDHIIPHSKGGAEKLEKLGQTT